MWPQVQLNNVAGPTEPKRETRTDIIAGERKGFRRALTNRRELEVGGVYGLSTMRLLWPLNAEFSRVRACLRGLNHRVTFHPH